jgi:hypothetical protein
VNSPEGERSEAVAESSRWSWPVANDPPHHIGDGSLVDQFPTRYEWRPDVEQRARWLVDTFDVWCNSYYDHPPGWGFQEASTDPDGTVWYIQNTSFDVWGPQGRGDPIDRTVGQQVFDTLWQEPNPPNMRWIIWQETLYWPGNDWQGELHVGGAMEATHDHIHVTYE